MVPCSNRSELWKQQILRHCSHTFVGHMVVYSSSLYNRGYYLNFLKTFRSSAGNLWRACQFWCFRWKTISHCLQQFLRKSVALVCIGSEIFFICITWPFVKSAFSSTSTYFLFVLSATEDALVALLMSLSLWKSLTWILLPFNENMQVPSLSLTLIFFLHPVFDTSG